MHLNIPPHEFELLTRRATAAGFASVETYVTQYVLTLAQRPREEELFAPLFDIELADSLSMIDRGMAEIDSGKGLAIDEARRRTIENIRSNNE